MKKYFPYISGFILTFVLIFIVSGFLFPETVYGGNADDSGWWSNNVIKPAAAWFATIMLQLFSLLTGLAGLILNGAIHYTVVMMAASYSKLGAIDTAWGTIRDLANMGFIFILLYAAIQTILGVGSDVKKLIVKVIIVAILINFSLFFTGLVIDASNILALLFYNAMVPGADSAVAWNVTNPGLSQAFMQHLNLQTLFQSTEAANITPGAIITIGVMGSIMLLIASFVFFAVAIMLIVRYVVLILVLILSPLAFMAFVLPALQDKAKQWKDALIGQAFFAPIYFMLTWITLHILSGVMGSLSLNLDPNASMALSAVAVGKDGSLTESTGAFIMFLNFVIVIVFLIVSLIIAKDWANKAGGAASKATRLLTGATMGTAAFAGRQSVGRLSQVMGESETLKRARDWGVKRGGLLGTTVGAGARLTQAASKKVGSSSLDIRGMGMGIGGTMDAGKAGGKGGYLASRKAADKREDEYARSQEPSDKAKAKAKREYEESEKAKEEATKKFGADSSQVAEAKRRLDKTKEEKDRIFGNKDEIGRQVKEEEENREDNINKIKNRDDLRTAVLEEKSAQDEVTRLKAEAEGSLTVEEHNRHQLEIEAAKRNLEKAKEAATQIREANRLAMQTENARADEEIARIRKGTIDSAKERRREAHAKSVENSIWGKIGGYNYTATAQIRKGESATDSAIKALKKLEEEGKLGEVKKAEPETPQTPPDQKHHE